MSGYTKFTKYTIDAVYNHLGIGEHQPELREAVRFIHKCGISNDYKYSHPSMAVTRTVESVQPRLNMLTHYEQDFFFNGDYERNALLIAVICGDMVADANNLANEPPKDGAADFSDDYAIQRAERLTDQARDLADYGLLPGEQVAPESVFIAHINDILDFYAAFESFDESDREYLTELRQKIKRTKTYCRPDTALGEELSGVIDEATTILNQAGLGHSVSVSFNKRNKFISFDALDKHDYALRRLATLMPCDSRAVRDMLKIYWSTAFDRYDDEALDIAEDGLEEALASFRTYTCDLDLDKDEYETALCSWLLADIVDIDSGDYQSLISDDTLALLYTLNDRQYGSPTLSQCLDDKALFTLIGLKAHATLCKKIDVYENSETAKKLSPHDIRADQTYAGKFLSEASPIHCKLSYDIHKEARKLRSLATPALIRNGFHLV